MHGQPGPQGPPSHLPWQHPAHAPHAGGAQQLELHPHQQHHDHHAHHHHGSAHDDRILLLFDLNGENALTPRRLCSPGRPRRSGSPGWACPHTCTPQALANNSANTPAPPPPPPRPAGVLTDHTPPREEGRYIRRDHVVRPHVERLLRLRECGSFRLGVYSSATLRTVNRALGLIRQELNNMRHKGVAGAASRVWGLAWVWVSV